MTDLPRGTVTFLFTDIEGSTALWERDRRATATAVELHLALLRTAIEAHGGELFKTVGDAVQAAFPTAPAAVAAALDAQRALRAQDWGESGPLRVRMALHAGEAEPDARGDYQTAPLNRLSRLLATGHGGQILLSQTVQQLSRGALSDGAELRDLGEHRLRDLLEPERVFQLLHPGLPAEFPPLKTLDARPNNLPRQPTPFLGRVREVGEVVALLRRDDVQLLTLTGSGGSGKTRLALQAAADLLENFPDGVYFVPLASLTDPTLVPAAIARALDVRVEGERPLDQRLQDFLSPKQVLLVLDNFEQLIAAAPAVGELLEVASGLRVLVTSRSPLRLRAEREYPVGPLGLPSRTLPLLPDGLTQYEAVRLFIERAQAVKPDFTVDNENASAVAEICHRLDGLPLAIELAAARIRMLPPFAMLSRLDRRLPMLTGGARDAPARQRTLRDTIAWSYDLLSSAEQALFRRVSVFAGGVSLEAADEVADSPGDLEIFGGLERLVEHSLMRQEEGTDGEPRFTMLETVREYGLEQLESHSEAEDVRRRMAIWLLRLAEQAFPEQFGPAQRRAQDQLEAEVDNLRAALGWAVGRGEAETAQRLSFATARFWYTRGNFAEGRSWAEQALASGPTSDAVRAKTLAAAGFLALEQGDDRLAIEWQEAGLALARKAGDTAWAAQAATSLGLALERQGRYAEAQALHEEALRDYRALGNTLWPPYALNALGLVAYAQGNIDGAAAYFAEALAEFRAVGNSYGAAFALTNLAKAARAQRDHSRAITLFTEALALWSEHGDRRGIAGCLRGLASIAALTGQLDRAARLGGAAEALHEAVGISSMRLSARYEHVTATVRAGLGDEAFATAWAAGRALSLTEAVSEAMELNSTSGPLLQKSATPIT